MTIRPETAADVEAIRDVNRLAFGQDDEARLVDALRGGGFVRLSLVAEESGLVVGHILFSDLPIITDVGTVPALALAPMAVLPEFQRRGIGSALVRRGLDECRRRGTGSSSCWATRTSTPASAFPPTWPHASPRRSPAGKRSWRWSWCRGRWTA